MPPDTARAEVQALAEQIAERAPFAMSSVKAVIDRGMDASLDAALRLEGESAGHTFWTEDRKEGMNAFLEHRKPKFNSTGVRLMVEILAVALTLLTGHVGGFVSGVNGPF